MRVALIGPTQSGKSTLFSAIGSTPLDPSHAASERHAMVEVPDERLDYLAELYKPKKYTCARLEFVDIPGVDLSTPDGPAHFRKTMPTVRQCDGVVMVVRAFESPSVAAYRGRIDPKADVEELHTELLFADLEQVTTRIEKLEKSTLKPTKTRDQELRELAMMRRVQAALEAEAPVGPAIHNEEERIIAAGFGFLTLKPALVAVNVAELQAGQPPPFQHPHARLTIAVSAEIEAQIALLDPKDRAAFLADLGLQQPARARLIRACYEAIGVISFLTCGEDEVRAWTIPAGTDAVTAAGKIHSDIERGFVRAETVAFDDLRAAGDMRGAKSAGKVRLEPKHYVVKDGDIINFRFNV